jgi:hypothetical protein
MVMDFELEAWLMRVLSQEDESSNHSRARFDLIEINVIRPHRLPPRQAIPFASDINGLERAVRSSRRLEKAVDPQPRKPRQN